MNRRMITVNEAIQQTGLPRSSMYRLIDDGTIRSVRIGARIYVAQLTLDHWIHQALPEDIPWPEATAPATSIEPETSGEPTYGSS
jgi:excisionase family DNA binding protein